MASRIADLVISLNTTRSYGMSRNCFFACTISRTCQLMASPSRSGSVASMSLSAPFKADVISFICFVEPASVCQAISKLLSG